MAHEPQPVSNPNSQRVQLEALEEFTQVFKEQWKRGVDKYGTSLTTFNGRDAGNDAFQELADAVAYVMQLRMENEWLKAQLNTKAIVQEYASCPRWEETGRLMQEILGSLKPRIGNIVVIPYGDGRVLIRTKINTLSGFTVGGGELNEILAQVEQMVHKETQQE